MRRLLHQLLQRIGHGPPAVVLRWLALCLLVVLAVPAPALAQGVELVQLQLRRADGALALDYNARLTLTPQIEEALQRGVPMYFTAQAQLLRHRWYWRDERVARISRSWRLSYQPLTASWRISLGGLSQVFTTLSEALAQLSRVSGWRIAEPGQIEAGERYVVEFSFQLDNSQLPRPMQIDLGGDWKLGIERSVKLE
ncbi:MAG: hypothetical protein CFE45_14865 [Burkholderiales bacterium PBB5]|nr:MAG: hypothetical protein CFE45_14865 [Burkholderiales bacterium PBB5]